MVTSRFANVQGLCPLAFLKSVIINTFNIKTPLSVALDNTLNDFRCLMITFVLVTLGCVLAQVDFIN